MDAVERFFILIIAGQFICTLGIAQGFERQSKENTFTPDKTNSLMFSASYVTNTNVMGSYSPDIRQPSVSPSLSFFSKHGFDLSVMGILVDNADDSLTHSAAEVDLMLGYTIRPAKGFVIYPSYTHFFHSANSNALKSIFSDEIRLDLDYNYNFFNLGASAGYDWGKKNTFYASFHNYYDIYVKRFLFRKASLSIQPGLDANFGSYEYLNLYYLDELRKDPYFYLYLLSYPSIRRYVIYQIMKNPDLTREEVIDRYLIDKAQDNFKLTSVSLNLPFIYMMGDFAVNLGLYLMIPVGQPDYMSDDMQFFLEIGVSYNLLFRGNRKPQQ